METQLIPFLRHGVKMWDNGCKPKWAQGYSHDPPLDPKYTDSIRETVDEVYSVSISSKIVTSPFLRCRQTAEIIQEYLQKEYHINTSIIVDNDLREYLGHWTSREIAIEISPETLSYLQGKELVETTNQFKARVARLVDKPWTKDSVWVVTHRLIILTLFCLLDPGPQSDELFRRPDITWYLFRL